MRPDERVDVQGLLWIQDGGTYGTSDNRNLSVFLRGMLLDDDARDLLPSWAGFVGGVIESNRLTPTASREDLQRDDHYAAIQHALAEALIAGLGEVARQQPEAWRRVLLRHNEALLGAALCDERLLRADDGQPARTHPPRATSRLPNSFRAERCMCCWTTTAASRKCCSVPWAYRWPMAIAMR